MWPWNASVTPPRPSTPPPRPAFPPSPIIALPGATPRVRDMIDFQGVHGGGALGFDYDDVPFQL
jgi:tyrosinase